MAYHPAVSLYVGYEFFVILCFNTVRYGLQRALTCTSTRESFHFVCLSCAQKACKACVTVKELKYSNVSTRQIFPSPNCAAAVVRLLQFSLHDYMIIYRKSMAIWNLHILHWYLMKLILIMGIAILGSTLLHQLAPRLSDEIVDLIVVL